MPTAVMLLLPDQLYEQATRLADQQRQELDQLLVDEIAKIIAAQTAKISDLAYPSAHDATTGDEIDATVERERTAYIAMHPLLKENYLGKHVAIHQGQLVDSDDDYDALYRRIDAAYPDVFVWLDTVSEEPIEVINVRSPFFIES